MTISDASFDELMRLFELFYLRWSILRSLMPMLGGWEEAFEEQANDPVVLRNNAELFSLLRAALISGRPIQEILPSPAGPTVH